MTKQRHVSEEQLRQFSAVLEEFWNRWPRTVILRAAGRIRAGELVDKDDRALVSRALLQKAHRIVEGGSDKYGRNPKPAELAQQLTEKLKITAKLAAEFLAGRKSSAMRKALTRLRRDQHPHTRRRTQRR